MVARVSIQSYGVTGVTRNICPAWSLSYVTSHVSFFHFRPCGEGFRDLYNTVYCFRVNFLDVERTLCYSIVPLVFSLEYCSAKW